MSDRAGQSVCGKQTENMFGVDIHLQVVGAALQKPVEMHLVFGRERTRGTSSAKHVAAA